jgi:spermidine synthase
LLYFLSGAAALVCEVSWSRQVGLVLGNTAEAVALVLAAFFAGMAVGQFAGGRLASRVRPLLGYGLAELAAAAWVCLVPTLLTAFRTADAGDTAAVLCFVVLLPASAAFGATFPFTAEHLAGVAVTGRRIALVYGLNTAGGVAGVVAATAFLLVEVGVVASSYLAAGVSAACGLVACALSARTRSDASPQRLAETETVPGLSWAVAVVSGFALLGLEVLYTRLFALVFHNSTYTFGAVVAVFLGGLALGAALVAAIGQRISPRLFAAAGCALGAVAVAASVVVFVRLTGLDYFSAGGTFAGYLIGVFALVAAVVLVPSILLGMTLPAILAANGSGRSVGRLTAANTVAAVAGALAAGFVSVPRLGLWGTFALFVSLCGFTGVAILLRTGWRTSAIGTALAVGVAAVVAGSGPRQAAQPPGTGEEVVRRWETAYGWIDVTRSQGDGALRVRQNLHYRHGSTGGAAREYRQGRLPLLLHPRPNEVAFLGLGTGLTAAPVVADRDVRSAVVVELIPEVVEAARLLRASNLGVVDHQKVQVRVDDARHYLQRTDRRFDVIVADLFVPWESRAGYLYTVEFYEAARRRLKPGGLFCQWLALYQFGPAEFELVADSFAAVFPEVTLWWGQLDGRFPILAMFGSEEPIELDPDRLAARWNALAELPGRADPELARPADLGALYLGRWPNRGSPRLNTDEHPRLEFAAPVNRGSGRSLSGPTLRGYYDEVLARLPEGSVRLTALGDSDPVRRRAAQRLGLFGPVPP